MNALKLTQLAALLLVAASLLLAAAGCEDDVTDLDYLRDAGADSGN